MYGRGSVDFPGMIQHVFDRSHGWLLGLMFTYLLRGAGRVIFWAPLADMPLLLRSSRICWRHVRPSSLVAPQANPTRH